MVSLCCERHASKGMEDRASLNSGAAASAPDGMACLGWDTQAFTQPDCIVRRACKLLIPVTE